MKNLISYLAQIFKIKHSRIGNSGQKWEMRFFMAKNWIVFEIKLPLCKEKPSTFRWLYHHYFPSAGNCHVNHMIQWLNMMLFFTTARTRAITDRHRLAYTALRLPRLCRAAAIAKIASCLLLLTLDWKAWCIIFLPRLHYHAILVCICSFRKP